jgi:hypothetical protein
MNKTLLRDRPSAQPCIRPQERIEPPKLQPLPVKARAALEAIGIYIHEREDDAPLLKRWKKAVA